MKLRVRVRPFKVRLKSGKIRIHKYHIPEIELRKDEFEALIKKFGLDIEKQKCFDLELVPHEKGFLIFRQPKPEEVKEMEKRMIKPKEVEYELEE